MFGYLRFSYHNRCFNDIIFNHNLRIQEFARIYLYCHCYIRVIVIQFFEIFIWLILDLLSEIMIKNGIIEASIVVRKSKIPNHWSSAVPKKYKRNAILRDLQRAHKISSNFELEKLRNKKRYLSVRFLYNFI